MSDDTEDKVDFYTVWKRATFAPKALFAGNEAGKRRIGPVAFAMIVATVAPVALALERFRFEALPGILIGVPLLTVVSIYLTAALSHLAVIVLRGRNGGLRDTVAAVGYAHAPLVFGVVPILGGFVGIVWHVVVMALGIQHAQRIAAWKAWIGAFVGSALPVLLALVLRAGALEAFKIPSGSMIPTLLIGEHVFVEKVSYGPLIPFTDKRLYEGLPPKRADLMVFKFPENREQDFLKRAIALPGDTLEAINGRPVINGMLVPHCRVGTYSYEGRTAELFVEFLGDRDYLTIFDADPDEEKCAPGADSGPSGLPCRGGISGMLQGPFHVAPGEVWVMGDNRNNSHDSRSWRAGLGAGVPFENIKGRAAIVWMSFGPDGGIRQDRLMTGLNGRPKLPAQAASLEPALDKCLRERPKVSETTPPAGKH